MSWLSKAWKETKRPFKKVFKEVERTYKRYGPTIAGAAAGYLVAGPIGGVAGTGVSAATGASAGTIAGIGAGVGYVAGGGLKRPMMGIPPLPPMSPMAKTVLAGERAQSVADQLKKRKRYKTAMGGGYGGLTLGKPGLLGI